VSGGVFRLGQLIEAHGDRLRLGSSPEEVSDYCGAKPVVIELPLPARGDDGRMDPGAMFDAERVVMHAQLGLARAGVFGVCPTATRIFLSQGSALVCDPWDDAFWQPSETVLRHQSAGVVVCPVAEWQRNAALMTRLAAALNAAKRVFVLREDRGEWGSASGHGPESKQRGAT
jgi:hypothetical protein